MTRIQRGSRSKSTKGGAAGSARRAKAVEDPALLDTHLLVRTPEGNLSHAMRWLKSKYSKRFNWAHRQSRHVFQGCFKALINEGRDGAAVRYSRHQLAEVERHIPGLNYAAAAQAVKRFTMAVEHDASRSRFVTPLKSDMSDE